MSTGLLGGRGIHRAWEWGLTPPVRSTGFQSSFEWRNWLMHRGLRAFGCVLERDIEEKDGSAFP